MQTWIPLFFLFLKYTFHSSSMQTIKSNTLRIIPQSIRNTYINTNISWSDKRQFTSIANERPNLSSIPHCWNKQKLKLTTHQSFGTPLRFSKQCASSSIEQSLGRIHLSLVVSCRVVRVKEIASLLSQPNPGQINHDRNPLCGNWQCRILEWDYIQWEIHLFVGVCFCRSVCVCIKR